MPTLATFNACQLSHRADEDYINKSLLDSIDKLVKSEPISFSESDHAAPHSYYDSPTLPDRYSRHPQPFNRPESPTMDHPPLSPTMSSNQDPMYEGFKVRFSSGMQLRSQTPFGSHIPVNVPSHIPNGLINVSGTNTSQNPSNPSSVSPGNSIALGHEEIRTIYVVGFPDDMQVGSD